MRIARPDGGWSSFLRAGLLAALVTATGCEDDAPITKQAALPQPPPIAISGCESTRAEPPSCALVGSRRLSLWVESTTPLSVWADQTQLSASPHTIEGDPGTALTLTVPEGARSLHVKIDGHRPWTIALSDAVATPELTTLFEAGDSAALKTHADSLEGRARAVALHHLALSHYRRGKRVEAAGAAHQSLDVALDEGAIAVALRTALLLLHLQEGLGVPADQRYVAGLVDLYLPAVLDARQKTLAHFYRGKLARTESDLRRAYEEFGAAARWARRLGLVEEELSTLSLLMTLQALLGRVEESDAAVQRMLALIAERPAGAACNDAAYLSAAGWTLAVSRFTHGTSADAAPLLERALELYSKDGGCDPSDNPDLRYALEETRFNHAFDALVGERYDEAAAMVDTMDPEAVSDEQRRYMAFVRARVALSKDDAKGSFAHLSSVDRGPSDPLLSWMWSIARGEALDGLKRPEDALAAYEEAEQKLDRALAAVGVDHGRESMAEGFRAGTVRLIERHLARGDMKAVVAAARRARARTWSPLQSSARLSGAPVAVREAFEQHISRYRVASRALQQRLRDLWTLNATARAQAQAELRSARVQMRQHLDHAYAALDAAPKKEAPSRRQPAAGELWLLYVPMDDAWLGLAMFGETIEHARIAPPTGTLDDVDASALLSPFSDALERAERVRVLPSADAWQVPVHAATWRGAPLIEQRPVEYALDLGTPPASAGAKGQGHALVVVDPASKGQGLGRLAHAPVEAATVRQALEGAGWKTRTLRGDDVTYEAFVDGLRGARWLHYAGHGEAGARSGWDAALPLAGEAQLDVRSILALPSAPSTVVLSGCETGRTRAQRVGGGVHLAAAFLLAGSDAVVAASDILADEDALALAEAMYESAALAGDSAERFRTGAQTFRQRHPESLAWRDLRLWTR